MVNMVVTPWGFDRDALLALNFDGGAAADFAMYWVSQTWVWIPFYVFMLYVVYRRVGLRAAAVFLVAAGLMVLCADQTSGLFKSYVPKFRPTHYEPIACDVHTVYGYVGGLYGTVSAHAANCLAFMILAGSVVRREWAWWVLGVWVAVVSYSRIYLGVHYPMDVCFGLLAGGFWGLVFAWLFRRGCKI